jgi:hypothetical protein
VGELDERVVEGSYLSCRVRDWFGRYRQSLLLEVWSAAGAEVELGETPVSRFERLSRDLQAHGTKLGDVLCLWF